MKLTIPFGKCSLLILLPESRLRLPIVKADFQVVLSASVARNLFGTVEAVGRTVQLNLADYTVVGVVKDVSNSCFFLCTDLDTFQFNRNSQEVLV